jgi:hypothetical protein
MEKVIDENQSKDDFESESNSNEKVMANTMTGNRKLQLIMEEKHEHTIKLEDQGLNNLIKSKAPHS